MSRGTATSCSSELSTSSVASRCKRSSNVFVGLGRNSDLMAASDLKLHITGVLEAHRENKSEFFYLIQVCHKDSSWEIQKRYSDMHYFSEKMMDQKNTRNGTKPMPFPSKIAGKATFDNATLKISALNDWLISFLQRASLFAPGSEVEQQFFNFIELYLHQPPHKDRMGRTFPDRVLHMGYLRKLGGNKTGGQGNWKKRYMVLQQDLQYFEDEEAFRNGGIPKGIIKLNSFCVERKADGLLNEFVVHSMPYPLVCRAATPEDMDAWTDALQMLGDGSHNSARFKKIENEEAEENENETDIKWVSR